MRPIHILTVLLLLTCALVTVTRAQHYSLLVQGGISSYHLENGMFFKGGGDDRWKLGPLIGLGLRWTVSRRFSVAASVEYSTHSVKNPLDGGGIPNDDPTNTIFDVNAVARWHVWQLERLYIFLPFGLGYWHQKVDPMEGDAPYAWNRPGFTASGLGGLFGLGLGVELARDLELYLEGTYRLRKYTTPAAQLGVAYRLD